MNFFYLSESKQGLGDFPTQVQGVLFFHPEQQDLIPGNLEPAGYSGGRSDLSGHTPAGSRLSGSLDLDRHDVNLLNSDKAPPRLKFWHW